MHKKNEENDAINSSSRLCCHTFPEPLGNNLSILFINN